MPITGIYNFAKLPSHFFRAYPIKVENATDGDFVAVKLDPPFVKVPGMMVKHRHVAVVPWENYKIQIPSIAPIKHICRNSKGAIINCECLDQIYCQHDAVPKELQLRYD